jgi:hypothetical protein
MLDSAVIIILLRRCDLRILDLPGLMLLMVNQPYEVWCWWIIA